MPLAAAMPDGDGDVFERAVTLVAIEHVLAALQAGRAAGDGDALVAAQAGLGHGRGRELHVDVVGDDEIEAAVAVVVEKRAAGAPAARRSSGRRDR